MTGRQDEPIQPGATLGVLGSGQLGRMFAVAARQMGYRVHTFSPDQDTPTGQVADLEVRSDYGDLDAVRQFARQVAVVTFEFENVPAETAAAAAETAPVRPAGSILHTTQHRLREKTFLSEAGFPVAPFQPVNSEQELTAALDELGTPAILKTAGWGYDGKGQVRIDKPDQAAAAWRKLSPGSEPTPTVLEGFVDFVREVSVVVARGLDGQMAVYPVFANAHRNHILDVTVCPAPVPPTVTERAHEIARAVAEQVGLVGVLCVEFFVTRTGSLIINELAPRPHNSGHLTIDACPCSQFEQQVRTVCGLPLGSTELLRPAAMANLLGDLWLPKPPDWRQALLSPSTKLHLYGKQDGRPGRKMGHLTALAETPEEAEQIVRQARSRLESRGSTT